MIDQLIHHAEVITLKGDSYRLKTATSAASQPQRPGTRPVSFGLVKEIVAGAVSRAGSVEAIGVWPGVRMARGLGRWRTG